MFELIHRIRQKPLHERKRITFLTALGVTLFILILWLVSLFITVPASLGTTKGAPSPFKGLSEGLKNGIDALKSFGGK